MWYHDIVCHCLSIVGWLTRQPTGLLLRLTQIQCNSIQSNPIQANPRARLQAIRSNGFKPSNVFENIVFWLYHYDLVGCQTRELLCWDVDAKPTTPTRAKTAKITRPYLANKFAPTQIIHFEPLWSGCCERAPKENCVAQKWLIRSISRYYWVGSWCVCQVGWLLLFFEPSWAN